MKHVKTVLTFFAVLSVALTACRKERGENLYSPVASMRETYSGKQGEGTEQPNSFFQLNLEDNGSLQAVNSNDSLQGTGKWQMNGNSFHASFRRESNNLDVNLAGVYDPATNSIKGTWGYGNFTIGGGSFYVEKEEVKKLTAKKNRGLPLDILLGRFL